jgi:hypothetical protein
MLRIVRNYYMCSGLALGVTLLAAGGCAGPNQVARTAPRIDFARFDAQRSPELVARLGKPPYVVYFEKGRVIPVDFALDSRLMSTRNEDFEIVVTQPFYVLFRADGPPLLSEDGVEFEERPENSFRFGFRLKGQEPTVVDLGLGIRR